MLIVQMTGMSGAGKTTIANRAAALLLQKGVEACVVDGDVYRQTLCRDLGFSPADRMENMRRLGKLASQLAQEGKLVIIAAINPFNVIRKELYYQYGAQLFWVHCSLDELIQRDTKGLYHRARLPDGHPEKIYNLTGVNDVFEQPDEIHFFTDTSTEHLDDIIQRFVDFLQKQIQGC